ncbi:hypothetical protein AB0K00_46030 [Dactylosporangium sp. NPDC049525]|uniref:hypothetical protein n=1 Tax=Dactylosporangium sp. NPDC049525 TaxID=3154730 RepID=UPI0034349F7B
MAATIALLTAMIGVLLVAFAWPSVRASLHDVPIVVAGQPDAVERVVSALEQHQPGAYVVTRVESTAAAETAVRDRQAYGAIDVTTGTPRVIVASGASAVVGQALQASASGLLQASGSAGAAHLALLDVAPLPADDPRGAGLAAGSLPLVIGGILAAFLLARMVRGLLQRVVGAVGFAVTGALALGAILQFWFGSLGGDYWANSGAIGLSIAATSLFILGLQSVIGSTGFAIGAALMMLVGNPLAGTSSAPEMLPGWLGNVGQLLPPSASGWLLRSTAFFDGHGAWPHAAVLLLWLAAGCVLCIVGAVRGARADKPVPAPTAIPELDPAR